MISAAEIKTAVESLPDERTATRQYTREIEIHNHQGDSVYTATIARFEGMATNLFGEDAEMHQWVHIDSDAVNQQITEIALFETPIYSKAQAARQPLILAAGEIIHHVQQNGAYGYIEWDGVITIATETNYEQAPKAVRRYYNRELMKAIAHDTKYMVDTYLKACLDQGDDADNELGEWAAQIMRKIGEIKRTNTRDGAE